MVVLVSECHNVRVEDGKVFGEFRYDGTFDGDKITGVEAWSRSFKPMIGDECVLHLDVEKVEDGILKGRIRRIKSLESIIEEMK